MDDQIRTLVESGELTFKGARKRYNLPPGVFGLLSRVGIEHANATGEPRAASITRACAIYWKLYDERRK